jgi:hypothetical protein
VEEAAEEEAQPAEDGNTNRHEWQQRTALGAGMEMP